MTVSKPKKLEEALRLIELQQSKIDHLHSKTDSFQAENDEFRRR